MMRRILEASDVSVDEAKEAMKGVLADVQLPGDEAQTANDLDAWIGRILPGSFGADRSS